MFPQQITIQNSQFTFLEKLQESYPSFMSVDWTITRRNYKFLKHCGIDASTICGF